MKSSSKPGMLIIVSLTMKLLCCGSPNAKCAFDLPLLSLFLLELKLQQFFPEKLCRKCLSEKSKVEEEERTGEARRGEEKKKRRETAVQSVAMVGARMGSFAVLMARVMKTTGGKLWLKPWGVPKITKANKRNFKQRSQRMQENQVSGEGF